MLELNATYSTMAMREKGGMFHFETAKKLWKHLDCHIHDYDPKQGKDNERRQTGLHEMSSVDTFSAV